MLNRIMPILWLSVFPADILWWAFSMAIQGLLV